MTDIVERLRYWRAQEHPKELGCLGNLLPEAADEIERLRAKLAEETEACARVAEAEREPEGPAPQEVMLLNPEDACIFGIRATKTCIAAAIRARTVES